MTSWTPPCSSVSNTSARAPFGRRASTSTCLMASSSGRQDLSPQVSQRRSRWGARISPFSQDPITLRSVRLAADMFSKREAYLATLAIQPCNESVTKRTRCVGSQRAACGKTPTPRFSARFCGSSGREREPKSGAAARDAVDADRPAHRLDEVLDDRETEARPAHVARTSAVDAVEALEQARQVARLDARAGVGDLHAQRVLHPLRAQPDARAGAAVLDGVVEQVGEHLLEPLAVGARRRQL